MAKGLLSYFVKQSINGKNVFGYKDWQKEIDDNMVVDTSGAIQVDHIEQSCWFQTFPLENEPILCFSPLL